MKRFFSLALALGIWAIYPTTSFSQSSQIGVTDLGDVTHSVAIRQVMKMLGNWEGNFINLTGRLLKHQQISSLHLMVIQLLKH